MSKVQSWLPKNFPDLLQRGNVEEIMAVFRDCDVNARSGYGKETALAFDRLPDDVARWLVQHGADLTAADIWGNTPLHTRARSWRSSVQVLLSLEADPHARNNYRETPLHAASTSHNARNARLLIEYGASIDELDGKGLTPLESALQSCQNIRIEAAFALSELLLRSGAARTPRMKDFVIKIGKNFEFHRSGFSPDHVEGVSSALKKLYAIFEVTPVPARQFHDGLSPIRTKSQRWQAQHEELWQLLVPSSGQADTVQGELTRIAGRIADEIYRNGGANWNGDYSKMADVFLSFLGTGQGLARNELEEVRSILRDLKKDQNGNTDRLAELAVKWVIQNPNPMMLGKQAYDR